MNLTILFLPSMWLLEGNIIITIFRRALKEPHYGNISALLHCGDFPLISLDYRHRVLSSHLAQRYKKKDGPYIVSRIRDNIQ